MWRNDQICSHWPPNMGSISEAKFFDSPYLVFKVEDAGYEVDFQEGMLKTLRYLHDQYDVNLICLEGAVGELVDLPHIKAILTPTDSERLPSLLQDRTLSAPEYLALTSDFPLVLEGIEQGNLYGDNTEALQLASKCYKLAEPLFLALQKHVDQLSERVLGDRLGAFVRAQRNYESDKLSFQAWVSNWLCPYAERIGLPIDEFPAVNALVGCFAREDALDFQMARVEMERLIIDITNIIYAPTVDRTVFERIVAVQHRLEAARHAAPESGAKNDVAAYKQFVGAVHKKLMAVSQAVRQEDLPASKALEELTEIAILYRFDLLQYPNFLRYSHYLQHAEAIDRRRLLRDLVEVIESISEALCSDADRRVLRADRAISGARRMCRLEAMPEEVNQTISEFGQLSFNALLTETLTAECADEELLQLAAAGRYMETELAQSGVRRGNGLESCAALFEKLVQTGNPLHVSVLMADL